MNKIKNACCVLPENYIVHGTNVRESVRVQTITIHHWGVIENGEKIFSFLISSNVNQNKCFSFYHELGDDPLRGFNLKKIQLIWINVFFDDKRESITVKKTCIRVLCVSNEQNVFVRRSVRVI